MFNNIKMRLLITNCMALVVAAFIAIFAWWSGASALVGASAFEVDETGKGAGYASVLYDNQNGLPTSEANAIVQSEDGYIWIGGYSGLIRYDGNTFYRYESTTVASVVSLFCDKEDRLWVGTNDSGVAMLEGDSFVFYKNQSEGNSASVRSISEDADGNIIAATTSGVQYIAIQDTYTQSGDLIKLASPRLESQYVKEIIADANGVIYGLTKSGTFFTIDGLNVTACYDQTDLGFEKMTCIYPDPDRDGYVYFGTGNAEVLYGKLGDDASKFVSYPTGEQTTVNCVRKINGLIWICADNGVGFLTEDKNYVLLQGVSLTNSIDNVISDYEGNIWFTSSRQGVMKIVKNKFTDVFAQAGLEKEVVNATCLLDGELYVGTENGLIILDENGEKKTNDLTAFLDNVRIRCIKKDSQGYLWLCTYGNMSLVRYDKRTDTFRSFTVADGLAHVKSRMMTELSTGEIAVATNGGVNIIKDDDIIQTYDSGSGISNLEILCIEEAEDGKLYLGSDGNGIFVIDRNTNTATHIGTKEGLLSEVIMRIKKDPKKEAYWIITSNSIAFLENGKVKTFTNFPYSNNLDIFFDKYDRIWVLSSNGVYVVNYNDMFAEGKLGYTHYDTNSGLYGINTANSYSCLQDDGLLYIATSTGVCTVNINDNTDSGSTIKIGVPYISVDDKNIWLNGDTEVHIAPTARRLNIYANAFTYSLNNPHLSYYLEGFDSEPTSTTKQNMPYASYTNLKGGTYKFHLSILDTTTGETVKTVTLTIIKDKAYYEQVWFYVLIGAIVLGVLGLIVANVYKSKVQKLRQKEEANRKLINEMDKVFARCIDLKDTYTNGHSTRVANYTAMIAEKLGKSPEEVEDIRNMALLHDIGKISIPDAILNKPGKLTDEEYEIMKTHAKRGYEILKDITIAPGVAAGAGFHHEKYDGTGYPNGLKGDEIPEVAQIIAVADAFDAMYSTRPYRRKMPLEEIVAEIKRCSGTQFNPRMVEAFLKLIDEGAFSDAVRVE